MNQFQRNLKENRYFLTLPTDIQETIIQSDVEFASEEELRTCAENLLMGN